MSGDQMTESQNPIAEPWETTATYGPADLRLHPLIREAYKVACLIERCGASPELTTASCAAFDLTIKLSAEFERLSIGRQNAQRINDNGAREIERLRTALLEIRRVTWASPWEAGKEAHALAEAALKHPSDSIAGEP